MKVGIDFHQYPFIHPLDLCPVHQRRFVLRHKTEEF